MRIIKAHNYEDMSKKAASIVSEVITQKPDCVLGLATGSTPEGMYQVLADKCKAGELDFSRVKTVNLDEYVGLSGEHPQSYHYFMKEKLLSKVNIDSNNSYLPDGMAEDINKECKQYEEIIQKLGGIDLQVVGIGNNGHIGFNEPSNEFYKDTHSVVLTEDTREANARFFDSIEEVPRSAITMGIKTIIKSKTIILIASGEGKRKILHEAIFGPITPNVPASVLQLHPNLIVISDQL